jgi:hypothetical protein
VASEEIAVSRIEPPEPDGREDLDDDEEEQWQEDERREQDDRTWAYSLTDVQDL